MGSMRKHIYRPHFLYPIVLIKQLEITRLGSRVTADVNHARCSELNQHLHHLGVHTRTRRISNEQVRLAVLFSESFGKNILYITSVENSILYLIQGCVFLGIIDGRSNLLNTNYLPTFTRQKQGDTTDTGIKVIDVFGSLQVSKFSRYLKKPGGLMGIRLKK